MLLVKVKRFDLGQTQNYLIVLIFLDGRSIVYIIIFSVLIFLVMQVQGYQT